MKICPKCKKIYSDTQPCCWKCCSELMRIDDKDVPEYDKTRIKNIEEKTKKLKTKLSTYNKQQVPIPTQQVTCPKCGSTQIQLVPRKWSLITGIFTNQVDRMCLNCKHKF